ncbi:hypothetical protein ACT17_06490 [Mycolicibacterium conceptionense]|uniref:Uncharacterized protein n=1 Tax=Mycolicibacterium conceptionense TaxID=451644 RepID=A0A0J8UH32_9MYCO|nr:hypothetical protein [Mycolicibacterium conceptionense]KMV19675.1 hypothetical protein ACT17_06490 [Mycolicibacterium conceptionense]
MLGSDPIAALLGAGLDPRSPQTVWKAYLRRLVGAGCAVTLLGPDVQVSPGARDEVLAALAVLTERFPQGVPMPPEPTGKLAGLGQVDTVGDRVNLRVAAYYRHIVKAVGKDLAPDLLATGVVTAGAAVHVGSSHMAAAVVPDAASMEQWREWAAQVSGDPHERHAAPTLLLPGYPGGGVFLFRTPFTVAEGEKPTRKGFTVLPPVTMQRGATRVVTGDVTVPIPPTRMGGHPVMRLGPCRMLPEWLESELRQAAQPAPAAA